MSLLSVRTPLRQAASFSVTRLRPVGPAGLLRLVVGVPAFWIFAAGASAQAPDGPGGDELPPARELVSRYVEAIGGRAAHAAPVSIRASGTVSVPSLEVEGEFELLQIPAVGSRMRTSVPGMGEMRMGFNEEAGWSVSDLAGASLMDDDELARVRERSLLEGTLRSPEVIRTAETVERTEFDGRACWRVRLVWRSGRETFDCYDVETGVLVASEEEQVGSRSSVPRLTIYEEYREFHGMRLPTVLRQSVMGTEQIMRIRDVVLDDADPSDLTPPEAVRELLPGPNGPTP